MGSNLPPLKSELIVEKKREVWRKENTVFHLDTVKEVGGIFEIELQKESNITKTDRELFASYQNALKPYLSKVIKGSNIDLVLKSKSNLFAYQLVHIYLLISNR